MDNHFRARRRATAAGAIGSIAAAGVEKVVNKFFGKRKRTDTITQVPKKAKMAPKKTISKRGKRKRSIKKSKKRRSRKGSKFSKAARSTAKLLTAMQPINTYSYQTAGANSSNSYTATTGQQCSYVLMAQHDQLGSANSAHVGTLTVFTISKLAALVTSSAAGNLSIKYYLHEASLNHTVTNAENSVGYLEAYYCVARRDIPESSPDTLTLLDDGFAEAGIASANWNNVDVTPYQSPAFCSNYKILKVQRVKMEAGESKTFSVNWVGRKPINFGRYILPTDQTTTALTVPRLYSELKGNKFILFRLKGQVSNDITNKTTQIQSTAMKIDVLNRYRFKFQLMADPSSTFYTENATGFTAPGTSAQIENTKTGVAAAPTAS